jgi:lysylphosphatidylglycerol synthetase-like protein (DUF2156 family)
LFVVLSLSWLFAPAYYHDHYGTLQLISDYEAGPMALSWLYRLCDVLAALVLMIGIFGSGVIKKDRAIAWLLFSVGFLAAIDGIFPDGCNLAQSLHCSTLATLSTIVHDVETAVLSTLLAIATIIDIVRNKRGISTAFLIIQIIIGLVALSGEFSVVSKQLVDVSQYVYEFTLIVWIGWRVSIFAPVMTTRANAIWIRQILGVWAAISGIFAIASSAAHLHLLTPLLDITWQHATPWVAQHGVIVGVLMLYVARHVYQGQRRAALLLLLIFASQVIKYALFAPEPIILAVYLLSFVALLGNLSAFKRNSGPLPLTARLQDSAVILGGVVVAIVLTWLVIIGIGHQPELRADLSQHYGPTISRVTRHDQMVRIHEQRFKTIGETLFISTLVVLLWSLFRPAGKAASTTELERGEVAELLAQFSNSSEDYFKQWPHDKNYFFNRQRTGFVAYKVVGRTAFALPDPICTPGRRRQLIQAFTEYCRQKGWAACFLPIPEPSLPIYENLRSRQIGSSAIIDLETFVTETSHNKWWRWQHNRATKAGWQFEWDLAPHSSLLMRDTKAVSDAWLTRSGHSEQGFAMGYYDEAYLQQCTIYSLRDASGAMIAFTNQIPSLKQLRQTSVDLIRFMPANDGAMPALMQHVLTELQVAGQFKTFDLGFVPLAKVDSKLASTFKSLAASRFSAAGLEQFKNKFRPHWQSQYIAYDGDILDLASIATNLENAMRGPKPANAPDPSDAPAVPS